MHNAQHQQDLVSLPSSGTRVRRAGCLAISIFTVLAFSGCERYALDRKMEELCKKDGGIKVYETVTLPAAEYEAIWKYAATAVTPADYYGPDYRAVATRELLAGKNAKPETGEGRLARLYWAIYRRSDDRLLGEQVEYRRDAGDLFTLGFQPSSSVCPHVDRSLAKSILVKGD